jgi:hypothetical protein
MDTVLGEVMCCRRRVVVVDPDGGDGAKQRYSFQSSFSRAAGRWSMEGMQRAVLKIHGTHQDVLQVQPVQGQTEKSTPSTLFNSVESFTALLLSKKSVFLSSSSVSTARPFHY